MFRYPIKVPLLTEEDLAQDVEFNHVVFSGESESTPPRYGLITSYEYRIVQCFCNDEVLNSKPELAFTWATYLQGEPYFGEVPSVYDRGEQRTSVRRFAFVVYRDLVYDFGGFQIARFETLIDLMAKTMLIPRIEFWVKFSHAAIRKHSQTLVQVGLIDFGSTLPPSFNTSDYIREIGSWLMALSPRSDAFDYALLINDPFDFEIPDEAFRSFFSEDGDYDMIQTWRNAFEHINWSRYIEEQEMDEDENYNTIENVGQETDMTI